MSVEFLYILRGIWFVLMNNTLIEIKYFLLAWIMRVSHCTPA
jgi:hypothetical protein